MHTKDYVTLIYRHLETPIPKSHLMCCHLLFTLSIMVQWLTFQLYIGQKPFPILDSELAILADGFVIFFSLLR